MPNRMRGTEYHGGARTLGPHYGKGPKGFRRSDERIREDVAEAIAYRSGVDASDVEVRVQDGIVLLEGTVRHRFDKRRLEIVAEDVDGVDEVYNELRLAKREGH